VAHAQVHFPDAFTSLPPAQASSFVKFTCECCSMSIQGLWVGQAFTGGPCGPTAGLRAVVRTIAIFDVRWIPFGGVRVYLVQDGMLFDHSSYSLTEADQMCGKYRYPFLLLAPNPNIIHLDALCRYYLSVFGDENAIHETGGQFTIDFAEVCHYIYRKWMRKEADWMREQGHWSTPRTELETETRRPMKTVEVPQKGMFCSLSVGPLYSLHLGHQPDSRPDSHSGSGIHPPQRSSKSRRSSDSSDKVSAVNQGGCDIANPCSGLYAQLRAGGAPRSFTLIEDT
jgi:hypothetical protein